MSHLKRQETPKNWPIPRKGTAYVVSPRSNLEKGIPLLLFVRNILKLTNDRKETKKALHENNILINNKIAKDEKQALLLFDVVSVIPLKKHFRVTLNENKKFSYEELSDKDSVHKVAKIIGKKLLKKGKIQLNLSDGRNFLVNKANEHKTNDSALVNLKENKIEKIIPLKEKANVLIIKGKNMGIKGEIKTIDLENGSVEIKSKEKLVHSLIKSLIVIE